MLRPGALSSEPLLLVEVSYEEGEVPSERHAAHSQSLTQALDRTCGYVHDLFVADPVRELMLESPARPKHGSRTLALNLLLPLRLPHRYRLLRYLLLLLRPAATATATAADEEVCPKRLTISQLLSVAERLQAFLHSWTKGRHAEASPVVRADLLALCMLICAGLTSCSTSSRRRISST